jgi:geranylgeranyl diphosphate synthase type II
MPSLPGFFAEHQKAVGAALDRMIPAGTPPTPKVVDAMRYTLLAPSKRVRAVLVTLSADLCGDRTHALPAACAIECVHAASLMLDDLPCMDNAPLRRGQPTAHAVYGEAITVLAAFGLLNASYGELARACDAPLAQLLARLF